MRMETTKDISNQLSILPEFGAVYGSGALPIEVG